MKSSSKEEQVGTGTYTFRMATPEEMVDKLRKELKQTSKWRFLKRLQLERSIEFWQIQSILKDNTPIK